MALPFSLSHRRCKLASAALVPFLFIPAVLFLSRQSLPSLPLYLYAVRSLPPPLQPFDRELPAAPLPDPVISDPPSDREIPAATPPEPSISAPPPPPPSDLVAVAADLVAVAAGGTPPEIPELPPPSDLAGRCDMYRGRWEKDEEGLYPLYQAGSCPYVDEAYGCQENGRPDGDYMRWRWKPDDCLLPRFKATDFLERLRGKRLMLVGDSMNRNQFESMLCLLREALPDKTRMYETRGYKITKGRGYFIFLIVDFNCTIVFVRSHFLVREGTHVKPQGGTRPTLMIDRIDKSSSRWKKADILVFNTGHWWTHGKTARGKDYYQEGNVIYPQFDAIEAFRRAMRTWGTWIDKNMNPRKNMVFYRGYSTAHFRGGDWDSGGTCKKETDPIATGAFLDNYPLKMRIVEEVIHEMQFPVILLNITRLTNFRKDGHPSIYGKNVTQGQKVSKRRQDCSHWCLPGVPDSWNELIYASLVLRQQGR